MQNFISLAPVMIYMEEGEGFQVRKLSAQIYVNHFKENRNTHQLTLELMIPHDNKKMLLKAY